MIMYFDSENLWIKVGLEVLFKISGIWENFASFCY
jgi:hypothetical protein